MNIGFDGRAVLVTGAASGIGRATAEALAGLGARIVASDIDAEAGTAAARTLADGGADVRFVAGDVADEDAVRGIVVTAVDAWGRLDAAANCAGTAAIRVRAARHPRERRVPGAIDTPMMDETFTRFPGFREALTGFVPMGRMGAATEVAAAIVWLLSDAASFITGEALTVEGGLLSR